MPRRDIFTVIVLTITLILVASIPEFYLRLSCAPIAETGLQHLVRVPIPSDFDWHGWVRQQYGIWAWNVEVTEPELNEVAWITPLHKYSVKPSLDGLAAYRNSRFYKPSVGDVLRCLGEPEYYEAFAYFEGRRIEYSFNMWYPTLGVSYGAFYIIYGGGPDTVTVDGKSIFLITSSTELTHAGFAPPGKLEDVVHYNLAPLIQAYPPLTLDSVLAKIRPWAGLEGITFEKEFSSFLE